MRKCIKNDIIPDFLRKFFFDHAVHCFQLNLHRTEINTARIDDKIISDKLRKATVLMQRGVNEKLWPSVLHFIIHVNRKNSSTVNGPQKKTKSNNS